MNIERWLTARREGRLSVIPLGMSVAMTAFGDNSFSFDVFSDGHGDGSDSDNGNGIGYGDYYHSICMSIPDGFGDIIHTEFGDGFFNGDGSGSGCGDGFLFLYQILEDLIKLKTNGNGIGHGQFDGYGSGNSSYDLDDLTQRFFQG